jgi:class 3 adenylate cyclase
MMLKSLGSYKKILAVDDEPVNLKLLEAKLVPEGYIVETTTSGQEALDMIKSIKPGLILLDVIMPGMDGYQVCEKIRADKSIAYIPIIFLTAMQTGQKDIIHGLDSGGDDYIRKPFDTFELLSRIRAALRVKNLYDELTLTKAELSRYVSLSTLQMVERVTSRENMPVGETKDVAVLFSDIRGFTNISENMKPQEVFEFLNLYLSKQISVVQDHHGIIDKLTGDEIMAVFEGPDMVSNAQRCASAIVKTLCTSKFCQHADWIGVGIGINAGPVYVGSIGSETMKDYTVIGNTVNIAARLCGLAKKFQILFTETTKNLIQGKEFRHRSVGKVSLKGISVPMEVFELML